MRKILTFAEKNDLIVKHQKGEFFYKDLELFKKYFPSHNLNTELANASQFSVERLDGQMLNELLNVAGISEILENRGLKEIKVRSYDELKTLILGFNIQNFKDPETFYELEKIALPESGKPLAECSDEEIRLFVDNLVNPKIKTIEEVKQIFIVADLNIENVQDSLFEDFIGKNIAESTSLIPEKFSFMKNKIKEGISDVDNQGDSSENGEAKTGSLEIKNLSKGITPGEETPGDENHGNPSQPKDESAASDAKTEENTPAKKKGQKPKSSQK